jgi:cardiolipin synthase
MYETQSANHRVSIFAIVQLVLSSLLAGCGPRDPIQPQFALQHTYSAHDPEFRRVMDRICGPPAIPGNSVKTILDQDEIMPAMIEAIKSAQKTITCETFILWSDSVGRQMIEAFSERARAGVQVHLIVDDVGSTMLSGADVKSMEEAGVHVVRFNPMHKVLLFFTAGDVNHRTHRKILVIDGRVAFTGGLGYSDLWLGDDQGGGPWRDNEYRIEGPVVGQIQAAFLTNWMKSVGQMLDGDGYFPPLPVQGDLACQFVMCSPHHELASIELMYLLAINAAEQTVDIATAYFVPDDLMVNALTSASKRGVKVRILMPGAHTDSTLARDASKASWARLLEAGIQLFEYQPAMTHSKVMVVDHCWTAVGSANLDPRSLRLSEEANLYVFDESFALEQTGILEKDLQQSQQITEWEHEKRSIFDHISQFFASIFSPQL